MKYIENNIRRIYLHKEDIWGNAPHWMTSASRDLFEHFYKAIKMTFLEQFKEPNINKKVKQILNLREWSSECSQIISKSADNKNPNFTLPILDLDKELDLPVEYEYDGDKIVPEEERIFDQNIYNTFEEFYNKADHGWDMNEKGKEICLGLYNHFIKEFNLKDLEEQMNHEIKESKNWNSLLMKSLKQYIESNSELKWHQFLFQEIDKEYSDERN